MASKIRFYVENSTQSESKYFNFEILDEELLEEFEDNIGYESYYSVRLSNHKRPSVMSGYCSYDHRYFINTSDKETYKLAKTYLRTILRKWEKRKITVDQLDDLLFNQDRRSMEEYLEREGK